MQLLYQNGLSDGEAVAEVPGGGGALRGGEAG